MKKILLPFLIIFVTPLISCSYGIDMLEGALTERASFSIEAEHDGASTLTVSWEETAPEHFAGWEIYMTIEPWNEYSEYKVIAASEYTALSLPSWITFNDNSSLAADSSRGASISVEVPSDPDMRGEYYVRAAIITFDEKPEDEWSDPETPEYYGDGENPRYDDYVNHTSVDSVSGFCPVMIF